MLKHLLSISTLFLCVGSYAQSVVTFEDVAIVAKDTTYIPETYGDVDGDYIFESGNARFHANIGYGFWGKFNCSNYADSTHNYSSVLGKGHNGSEKYGIAFVPTDFNGEDRTRTIPVSLKLLNEAEGNVVTGAYFTTAHYTYNYALENFVNTSFYLQLVVRGYYQNKQVEDSVVHTLICLDSNNAVANYEAGDSWKFVNLTSLGLVDSLTFDLVTNDTVGGWGPNVPAYFVMDDLMLNEGECFALDEIALTNATSTSLTFEWNSLQGDYVAEYEIALDKNATLDPSGTVTSTDELTYTFEDLDPSTTYYLHYRIVCSNQSTTDWDTIQVNTLAPASLNNLNQTPINIYPNPAVSKVNISTNAVVNNFAIVNAVGQVISEGNVVNNAVNVEHLPAGVYHIRLFENNQYVGQVRFSKL